VTKFSQARLFFLGNAVYQLAKKILGAVILEN